MLQIHLHFCIPGAQSQSAPFRYCPRLPILEPIYPLLLGYGCIRIRWGETTQHGPDILIVLPFAIKVDDNAADVFVQEVAILGCVVSHAQQAFYLALDES